MRNLSGDSEEHWAGTRVTGNTGLLLVNRLGVKEAAWPLIGSKQYQYMIHITSRCQDLLFLSRFRGLFVGFAISAFHTSRVQTNVCSLPILSLDVEVGHEMIEFYPSFDNRTY